MISKTFPLFQNKYVRYILLSNLFLQIGIWIRNFAILLFVMEQTNGNAIAISMISIAEYAPIFLFSFIGGTFADRWRPKQTMFWCSFLSSVSIFIVLLTLVFGTWKVIFFATLFSSILSQFSQPSGRKLFKAHVSAEHLQQSISYYQTTTSLFIILGPVIGTAIYQQFGISWAIVLTGISFALSALVLTFLPKDETVKSKSNRKVHQEMLDGFRYVFSRRELLLLGACFITVGISGGLIQPLNIFLVTEQLQLPKESLQWLMIANGLGMIIGSGMGVALSKKLPPHKMLTIGMVISAGGVSIIGFSEWLWVTLIAEVAVGFVMPLIQIGVYTLVVLQVEEAYIGRVSGILNPLFTGAMVLAMAAVGSLKAFFSITLLFQLASLLFVLGFIAAVWITLAPKKKEQLHVEVQSS
ncbi:MFS transporter [Mechercharimyces sp. CAU 1602]|uniref:MFS transporter n=1 Tax=Mechercharimyces sp. CAU 1602 TaxID=2973933 RepID=UPI002163805E|nr:MFS transporter [Mechercharimyces sp. CAU 1602]MCS1350384.1 MFS transporter [Mechercharimyces sp. CAU 1602]